MSWLRDAGFPVPQVFPSRGDALVMERIEGPTLAQAIIAGICEAEDAGRLMAALHDRLHALDASAAPVPVEGRLGERTLLHLDLHPLNVLLRGGDPADPVVIDWTNAALGTAGLDVALSAVIMGQVALAPETAGLVAREVGRRLREYLAGFLTGVAAAAVPHLESAARRRSADPNLTEAELATVAHAAELVRLLAEGRDSVIEQPRG